MDRAPNDSHCFQVFQARDREHERIDAALDESVCESFDGLRVAGENGGAIDEKVGEGAFAGEAGEDGFRFRDSADFNPTALILRDAA